MLYLHIFITIKTSSTHSQAPAVYRKIPVYRDLTRIPIPVFLKNKYRYFSVCMYSTEDNFFKEVGRFLAYFVTSLDGNIRFIPYRKIPVYRDFAKIPYRTVPE